MTSTTPMTPPEPVNLTHLAAVVRSFRGTRPLSQAARESGISAATLSRIESGRTIPDMRSTLRLARWTGLPIDELVQGDEQRALVRAAGPTEPSGGTLGLADQIAYLLHKDGTLDSELIEAFRHVIALIVERSAQRQQSLGSAHA